MQVAPLAGYALAAQPPLSAHFRHIVARAHRVSLQRIRQAGRMIANQHTARFLFAAMTALMVAAPAAAHHERIDARVDVGRPIDVAGIPCAPEADLFEPFGPVSAPLAPWEAAHAGSGMAPVPWTPRKSAMAANGDHVPGS